MDIGAKLRQRRMELNVSVEELADKLGVSRTTIYRYEKGEISKVPTETLEKISKILNTTPGFFMGWSDISEIPKHHKMIAIYNELEEHRQEKVLDFAQEQLDDQTSSKVVSLFDKQLENEELFKVQGTTFAAAASGFGRGYEADDYDTYTVYTDEEPPAYDYAIGVKGDSMLPRYEPGDMLFLKDRGMSTYNGLLCIVVYNGQTYFKKVYTEEDGLRLVSLNKKYNDIFIDYPPVEDTYIKIYDVVGSFTPVEI